VKPGDPGRIVHMPGNVRLWGLAVAAFGAGAATLGVGGAFLRNRTFRQELRLYPPGVELSTVAGVSIRRNTSSYGDDRPEGALMWMSPRGVPDIIREIEEEPRIEVLEETRLPQGKFDIHYLPPREQPAVLQARMRDAVSRAFGIAWTREKQRQHVYVLRSVPGVDLGFEAHPGGNGSVSSWSDESGFTLSFLGVTIGDLSEQLGNRLHMRIIDETGLTGTWQGGLHWGQDSDALAGALREKGLDLALEVREVDVIVIRRR
jgi:hypothetical protein